MSHIATIETKFKDKKVLKKTCDRLGIRYENVTNYKFYDGTRKSGLAIYLSGWKYPAVITDEGEIFYDNYNGSWGSIEKLNKVKDYYGLEKAKKAARSKGYSYKERKNKDGNLQLVVNV
jgi:gamma-glutamylcyclotransferase (GGCT)/AIG2-like uncharacterized protein YtfP